MPIGDDSLNLALLAPRSGRRVLDLCTGAAARAQACRA